MGEGLMFAGQTGTIHVSGIARWEKVVDGSGVEAWDKTPETWRATIAQQDATIKALVAYIEQVIPKLNGLLTDVGDTPIDDFIVINPAPVPVGGAPFASELGYQVQELTGNDGTYVRVDLTGIDGTGGPLHVTLNSGQNWLDFWNTARVPWIAEVDGAEIVRAVPDEGVNYVYSTTPNNDTAVTIRPHAGYGPAFVISFDDPGKVVA